MGACSLYVNRWRWLSFPSPFHKGRLDITTDWAGCLKFARTVLRAENPPGALTRCRDLIHSSLLALSPPPFLFCFSTVVWLRGDAVFRGVVSQGSSGSCGRGGDGVTIRYKVRRGCMDWTGLVGTGWRGIYIWDVQIQYTLTFEKRE